MQSHLLTQISGQSSYSVASLVPTNLRLRAMSPVQRLKAIKNSSELKGMRKAHVSTYPV